MLKISARLIFEEAQRRGWKAEPLDERFISTIAVTPPGGRTYYFDSCQSPLMSAAAMNIADNKLSTYVIAQKLDIPVADFAMYHPATAADFLRAQVSAGHEVVVKPIDTNHGDGITIGITNVAQLEDAVRHATTFSSRIILQRRRSGIDCRVTVVDGKAVAAARRSPAYVVGDGHHTIRQLIGQKNKDPSRGKGHHAALSHIDVAAAERYLGTKALRSVPATGEHVTVVATANLSKGGEAADITDTIHKSYKEAAIRLVNALDMLVCGVDFLVDDYTQPLAPTNGTLLEINATPGLRMHHFPSVGKPRDVAKAILDAFAAKIASTNN